MQRNDSHATLRIAARATLARHEGGISGRTRVADHDVPAVALTGPGVDATAEIDDDGEVADLRGTYPASLHRALTEIAELAHGNAHPAWGDACADSIGVIASGEVVEVERVREAA